MSLVRHAETIKELDAILDAKSESLVVIDFHAAWSAPCHLISPVIDALSKSVSADKLLFLHSSWPNLWNNLLTRVSQYPHVAFVKVDTDRVPTAMVRYEVKSMPTFHFIKNKTIVDTVGGPDKAAIQAAITKHATAPAASTSGSSEPSDVSQTIVPTVYDWRILHQVSLLEFIDRSQTNCLNENLTHTLKSILTGHSRNTSDAFLESDTDEQLIMNIPVSLTCCSKNLLGRHIPVQPDSESARDIHQMQRASSCT